MRSIRLAPALLALLALAACSEANKAPASAAPASPSSAAGAPAAAKVDVPGAQAELGKPAPGFSAPDANGATRTLAEFAGKVVVLEWNNPDCPFVRKHYGAGNMQALQKELTGKGVIWLTVSSSAPGKQGHMNGEQAKAMLAAAGAVPTAYLLDHEGAVGRAYGAKTTPHMYVIDPTGTLVYAGGIDDKPTANADDIAGAKPFVKLAVEEVLAGKPVTTAATQPYGCSVKYGS